MKTLAEIRRDLFDYHRTYYSYLFTEWKWYSYRKYKMYFYLNTAPLVVYLCMRLGITPNVVTITYVLLGILGGIFLAIPIKWLILAGIILFFFRPILDWSDGMLARATGKTSITGDVLDSYGAIAGWVPLWVGLGLYAANKFGDMGNYLSGYSVETIFFYLTPIIPALIAINVITSARNRLYEEHIVKSVRNNLIKGRGAKAALKKSTASPATNYSRIRKIFSFIDKIFEHNARTVDLICLILTLELFLPFFISWAIFLVFLAWQIVYFIASFYLIARGGWAEEELKNKLEQIHKE